RRRLARVLGEQADRLVEAVAVPDAQIDLIVAAIEAEPAHPVLARWNLFLVIVTGICDRNLLCHFRPPFPSSQYILTSTIARNAPQVKCWGGRMGAPVAADAGASGRHGAPVAPGGVYRYWSPSTLRAWVT